MDLQIFSMRLTRAFFYTSLLLAVTYCTIILFVYPPIDFFARYLQFIADSSHSPLGSEKGTMVVRYAYQMARVAAIAASAFIWLRAIRYYKGKIPYLLFNAEHKLFEHTASAISGNVLFFKSLPKTIKVSLLLLISAQFALSIYLALSIPFFYDEAWSYMYFSGRGLIATISYYPAPNNHVFFNVIGSIFNILPLDPVLILRLPVIFWGLLSTWYFFKLCSRMLSPLASMLTTILFASSFPCIYFNSMGRGYAMLIFFTALALYCLISLCFTVHKRKYLMLFSTACVAGFYTIPSFLYCYLPLVFFLFLFYLLQNRRELRGFIIAQLWVAAATVILYLPIIAVNGIKALVANNGVITRDLAFIKEHANEHFVSTWNWMLGTNVIPFSYLIVFISLLLLRSLFYQRLEKKLILVLFVFMMASPLLFVYLQRTIPFERTWSFLIVPLIAGTGIFIEDIISIFLRKGHRQRLALVILIPFSVCCILYAAYLVRVKKQMQHTDYLVQLYLRPLGNKLNEKTTVGFAAEDLNFYLAEDMQFEAIRQSGKFGPAPQILNPGTIPTQDIIILKKSGKDVNYNLTGYDQMQVEEPIWNIYIKKGL